MNRPALHLVEPHGRAAGSLLEAYRELAGEHGEPLGLPGLCWPEERELAARIGLSLRALQRQRRELEAEGAILAVRSGGVHMPGSPDHARGGFYVLVRALWLAADARGRRAVREVLTEHRLFAGDLGRIASAIGVVVAVLGSSVTTNAAKGQCVDSTPGRIRPRVRTLREGEKWPPGAAA